MSGVRNRRVAELLLSFLGEKLSRSRSENLQLVTLTGVDVTGDLKHATIYWTARLSPSISVSYEEFQKREPVAEAAPFLELLTKEIPVLKRAIGRELELRYVPELHFRYDDSANRGARIDFLLGKLSQKDTTDRSEN